MLNKQRIIKNLKASAVMEAVSKLTPFIVLAHLQRVLGVQEFGRAQLAISWLDLILLFIMFGFNHRASIAIGAVSSEKERVSDIYLQLLPLKALHAVVGCVLVFAYLALHNEQRETLYLVLAGSFVVFSSVLEPSAIFQGTQSLHRFAKVATVSKLLNVVLILTCVRGSKDAAIYVALYSFGNFLISCVSFFWCLKHRFIHHIPKLKMQDLLTEWKTSLPFGCALYSYIVLERIDLLALGNIASPDDLGLYAMIQRLVRAVQPLTMGISVIFFSEMVGVSHQEKQASLERHHQVGFTSVVFLIAPVIAGSFLFQRDVLALFYHASFAPQMSQWNLGILSLTLIGALFIQTFGFQILLLKRRGYALAVSCVVGVLTTVAAMMIPVDVGFPLKTSYASILGYTVAAAMVLLQTRSFFSLHFFRSLLGRSLMILAKAALFFGLAYVIKPWAGFYVSVGLAAVCFFSVAFLWKDFFFRRINP